MTMPVHAFRCYSLPRLAGHLSTSVELIHQSQIYYHKTHDFWSKKNPTTMNVCTIHDCFHLCYIWISNPYTMACTLECNFQHLNPLNVYIPQFMHMQSWYVYIPQFGHWMYKFHGFSHWMYTFHSYRHSMQHIYVVDVYNLWSNETML